MELNATDSQKNIFDLIIFRYDSPNKCPTILYAVNLWLKPASATGAKKMTAPSQYNAPKSVIIIMMTYDYMITYNSI